MFWHRSILPIITIVGTSLLSTSVSLASPNALGIARGVSSSEIAKVDSQESLLPTSHISHSQIASTSTRKLFESEAINPDGVEDLSIDDLSKIGRQITVTIENLKDKTKGLGVIIDRRGNTYTVLTTKYALRKGKNYRLTTMDGIGYDVTEREVALANNALDLAVVEFTSDRLYTVAKIGDSTTMREGITIYKAGYTQLLDNLAPDAVYTFKSASLLSIISSKDSQTGYQLVDNNPLTIASTGGAILDSKGLLVGIQGRAAYDRTTRRSMGLGIPIERYLNTQNSFVFTPN